MRIMLTDRTDASAALTTRLLEAGHEVFDTCLPEDDGQHGCSGLRRGRCPLHAGVDVAVSTIDHRPEAASAGTVCARRNGIRVVSIGRFDLDHPDLDVMLARDADEGDEFVTDAVSRELARTVELMGLPPCTVRIQHRPDVDRIIATVPSKLTTSERSRLAVRLLDAATATGRGGERRDVIVRSSGTVLAR